MKPEEIYSSQQRQVQQQKRLRILQPKNNQVQIDSQKDYSNNNQRNRLNHNQSLDSSFKNNQSQNLSNSIQQRNDKFYQKIVKIYSTGNLRSNQIKKTRTRNFSQQNLRECDNNNKEILPSINKIVSLDYNNISLGSQHEQNLNKNIQITSIQKQSEVHNYFQRQNKFINSEQLYNLLNESIEELNEENEYEINKNFLKTQILKKKDRTINQILNNKYLYEKNVFSSQLLVENRFIWEIKAILIDTFLYQKEPKLEYNWKFEEVLPYLQCLGAQQIRGQDLDDNTLTQVFNFIDSENKYLDAFLKDYHYQKYILSLFQHDIENIPSIQIPNNMVVFTNQVQQRTFYFSHENYIRMDNEQFIKNNQFNENELLIILLQNLNNLNNLHKNNIYLMEFQLSDIVFTLDDGKFKFSNFSKSIILPPEISRNEFGYEIHHQNQNYLLFSLRQILEIDQEKHKKYYYNYSLRSQDLFQLVMCFLQLKNQIFINKLTEKRNFQAIISKELKNRKKYILSDIICLLIENCINWTKDISELILDDIIPNINTDMLHQNEIKQKIIKHYKPYNHQQQNIIFGQYYFLSLQFKKSEQIFQQLFSKKNTEQSQTMTKQQYFILGFLWKNQLLNQKYDEALKNLEKYMNYIQNDFIEFSREQLIYDMKFASILYKKIGNLELAIGSLELIEKILGQLNETNHKQMPYILENLGFLYLEHGDSEKSFSYYKKAEIRYKALNLGGQLNDIQLYSKIMLNLGIFFSKNDQLSKAIEYIEEVFQMQKILHGENDIQLAHTCTILGDLCAKNQQIKKSETYYLLHLAIIQSELGETDQRTLLSRRNLANLYINNYGQKKQYVNLCCNLLKENLQIIHEKIQNQQHEQEINLNIYYNYLIDYGEIFFKANEISLAQNTFLQALNVAKEMDFQNDKVKINICQKWLEKIAKKI